MAPSRKRTISRDEPAPLRRGSRATVFTAEDMLDVVVFVAAAVLGGYGVYLKTYQDGASLRVKIYGENDSWQDTLASGEDTVEALLDYSDQLKIRQEYETLEMAARRRRHARAPEAPPEADPPGMPAETLPASLKAGRKA